MNSRSDAQARTAEAVAVRVRSCVRRAAVNGEVLEPSQRLPLAHPCRFGEAPLPDRATRLKRLSRKANSELSDQVWVNGAHGNFDFVGESYILNMVFTVGVAMIVSAEFTGTRSAVSRKPGRGAATACRVLHRLILKRPRCDRSPTAPPPTQRRIAHLFSDPHSAANEAGKRRVCGWRGESRRERKASRSGPTSHRRSCAGLGQRRQWLARH